MGTNAATATCKLTPTSDPAVFNSSAGNVSLILIPTSGNVTFMVKDTDVLDQSGNSVNPTKTATTLTFTAASGKTYLVEAEYFIFPTHSTGTLQENCTGGTVLSQVSAVTNPQQFTIKA